MLAALVIASVWSGHVAFLAAAAGLAWPVELWSGAIVLSSLVAAALGGLTSPAASEAHNARRRQRERPAAPDLPLRRPWLFGTLPIPANQDDDFAQD